jgi:hypothetical protein
MAQQWEMNLQLFGAHPHDRSVTSTIAGAIA